MDQGTKGVILLTITLNASLVKMLLPVSVILNSISLEVFSTEERYASPEVYLKTATFSFQASYAAGEMARKREGVTD